MFSLGNGTVADGPRVKLLIYHHWGNVQSRRNFSIRELTINVCVWPPQSLTQHETFKPNRYTLFSIDGLKILFNNNDVQMMSFYLVSPLVGISNGTLSGVGHCCDWNLFGVSLQNHLLHTTVSLAVFGARLLISMN